MMPEKYTFICPKKGEPVDDFFCCMLCDSPPQGWDEDEWQSKCWEKNMILIDDRWHSRHDIPSSLLKESIK